MELGVEVVVVGWMSDGLMKKEENIYWLWAVDSVYQPLSRATRLSNLL